MRKRLVPGSHALEVGAHAVVAVELKRDVLRGTQLLPEPVPVPVPVRVPVPVDF